MGREIIYDRCFIKLSDGTYIPVIQQGSSNCYEYNYFTKKEIPEKNWWNIRHIFDKASKKDIWRDFWSKEQLEELADEWDKNENYKTRNKPFETGEFKRWFLNGLKNAKTIRELQEYGIILYIWVDCHYLGKQYFHYLDIQNEFDLVTKINRIKEWCSEQNLPNGPTLYTIGFRERNCMKRIPKRTKTFKPEKPMTKYYIIGKRSQNLFIYKKTPIRWVFCIHKNDAKKFRTAKDAAKWLAKYQYKLDEPKEWNIFEVNTENNN